MRCILCRNAEDGVPYAQIVESLINSNLAEHKLLLRMGRFGGIISAGKDGDLWIAKIAAVAVAAAVPRFWS